MVARLNGVQEAAGSNPVTRTKRTGGPKGPPVLLMCAFVCCEPAASCQFNQRPRSGLGGVHRRTGRWFKSSHSDQKEEGVERHSLLFGICGRFENQRPLAFQSTAAERPGRRPSPHRPLAQIQSLGPRKRLYFERNQAFFVTFNWHYPYMRTSVPKSRYAGTQVRMFFFIYKMARGKNQEWGKNG